MILFIAPNPHKVKEKEGFLQRVAAIDGVFADKNKFYSEDFDDSKRLAQALVEADLVYVHSIYNANKILRCYPKFAHKIITDLHGVVPEEEQFADNWEMVSVMSVTEREVFKYGKYFVAVSEAMVKHFENKYDLGNKVTWVVLPIFMGVKGKPHLKNVSKKPLNVIYAGGAQRWQNVELMINAICKTNDDYSYTILTHSTDAFSKAKETAHSKVDIQTVTSSEISKYYQEAVFGFVLRDDTLVNNVACPTKLIEYLSHGVVPIVLSENIGDFKSLGYSYVKIKDFLTNKITDQFIEEAINNNYKVYEKFTKKCENGTDQLMKLSKQINNEPRKEISSSPVDLVAMEIKTQEQATEILRYEYQIEVYKKKIADYAEALEHHRRLSEKAGRFEERIKQFSSRLKKRPHN